MPTIKRHWRGWRAKRAPTVLIFFPPSPLAVFLFDSGGAVCAVQTDKGEIACDEVVIAVGPWVRQLWLMLGLPDSIGVKANGVVKEMPMWRYWSLQEGTLGVNPDFLTDAAAICRLSRMWIVMFR